MFKLTQDVTVHFVGIGGIGMSGLAKLLHFWNISVTGSDISHNQNIKNLEKLNIKVFLNHHQDNIKGASLIVYSSAIKMDNPELVYAKKRGIPILKRAEMIAQIMRLKYGIAVAGTHGKTTTTSFLATIMHSCNMDPTYIIGGIVSNLDGNVGLGKSEYLITEADESDGSFLELYPCLMIVTNIDNDHLDHYQNIKNLERSFLKFIKHLPFYGLCALNIEDPILQKLKNKVARIVTTFGFHDNADFCAKNIKYSTDGSSFDLWHKQNLVGNIEIALFGEHNVLNALGAIAISFRLGLSFEKIKKGIINCKNIGRRQQFLYDKDSFKVISDYAHHPTAIRETIRSVKKIYPKDKLIVVFEPHRYTRTRDSWSDFLHAFNEADHLYLAPIYPASEKEISGISSDILANDINRIHPGFVTRINDFNLDFLNTPNTVLLCMGAGTIGGLVEKWTNQL